MNELMNETLRIASLGGEIIKKNFGTEFEIRYKGRGDLVTATDLEVEAAVTKEIRRKYPNHSIECEEKTGNVTNNSGYTWYIDPVDGTTNFAHSFPFVCISIGIEKDGEMLAGVVYNPIMNEKFHAYKGMGAYLNGNRISVSNTASLEKSLLVTGFAYNFRDAGPVRSNFKNFFTLSQESQAIRRTGSAALDLCYVAKGVFDGFWEMYLHSWDVSAGSLIVKEAGGSVSNFNGDRFDVSGDEILATNSKIHHLLIEALSRQD